MSTGYFPSFQQFVNNTTVVEIQDKLSVPSAYSCFVSVVSATLPITMFNLKSNKIDFTYRVVGEVTNRLFTFNIPKARWTSTELADVLQWNGILPGTTTFSQFFCVYYGQSNTFQFNFLPNTNLSLFALVPGILLNQMGFTSTGDHIPNSIIPSTAPNSWVDPSYPLCTSSVGNTGADLSGTNNILIYTSLKVKQYSGGTNLLAVVPINVEYTQTQQFASLFQAKMYDNTLQNFSVWFTDDDGVPIDFHGAKWSVVLEFSFRAPDILPLYQDTVDPSIAQQELSSNDFLSNM